MNLEELLKEKEEIAFLQGIEFSVIIFRDAKDTALGYATHKTKETLNAIDSRIATLALNTEQHRKSGNIKPDELYMCYSKEIAYQECRNIILKVMEESVS